MWSLVFGLIPLGTVSLLFYTVCLSLPLFMMPIVLSIALCTLSAEPRVGKTQAKKTQGAIGTADTFILS